jgi:predicted metal-dependent hydrolase
VGVGQIPDIARSSLDSVDLARRLMKSGRAFSAHEVLEDRWKHGPVEERDLWRGLAQLCVAMTHAQRGNAVGAQRLLERAEGLLDTYGATAGPTYGVDLARACRRARAEVAAGRT